MTETTPKQWSVYSLLWDELLQKQLAKLRQDVNQDIRQDMQTAFCGICKYNDELKTFHETHMYPYCACNKTMIFKSSEGLTDVEKRTTEMDEIITWDNRLTAYILQLEDRKTNSFFGNLWMKISLQNRILNYKIEDCWHYKTSLLLRKFILSMEQMVHDSEKQKEQFKHRTRWSVPKTKPIPTSNDYAVLGLQNNASSAQIRKAYLDLARQYHPDRLSPLLDEASKQNAIEKFQQINNAYHIINKTS